MARIWDLTADAVYRVVQYNDFNNTCHAFGPYFSKSPAVSMFKRLVNEREEGLAFAKRMESAHMIQYWENLQLHIEEGKTTWEEVQ